MVDTSGCQELGTWKQERDEAPGLLAFKYERRRRAGWRDSHTTQRCYRISWEQPAASPTFANKVGQTARGPGLQACKLH